MNTQQELAEKIKAIFGAMGNMRNTQFSVSAERLIEQLESIHALRMDIVQDEVKTLIANYAHDLVCHSVQLLTTPELELLKKGMITPEQAICGIQDMPEEKQ